MYNTVRKLLQLEYGIFLAQKLLLFYDIPNTLSLLTEFIALLKDGVNNAFCKQRLKSQRGHVEKTLSPKVHGPLTVNIT